MSSSKSDAPGPLVASAARARPPSNPGAGGPSSDGARALFGWVGLLLVVVSGADVLLTWLPPELGNPEWEFGTVTASFNGLISVTVGFALILYGLYDSGRGGLLKGVSAVLGVTALLVLAAAALYWLSVPLALGSVEGGIRVGLQKAVVKTSLQSIAFPVAYLAMARAAWKWSA